MRAIIHVDATDKSQVGDLLRDIAGDIGGGAAAGQVVRGPDARGAYLVDREEDPPPDRSAADPTARRFYRHLYVVEVLSEENLEGPDPGLAAIAAMIVDGPCSGRVDLVDTREIDGPAAAAALRAQDSDPGFFQLTDMGQDCD